MHSFAQVNHILDATHLNSTRKQNNQAHTSQESLSFKQEFDQQRNMHQQNTQETSNKQLDTSSKKANETSASSSTNAESSPDESLTKEIQDWLAKLSPEEQAEFREALENNPEAALAMLPERLQQLVNELKQEEKANLLAQLRLNQDKDAKAQMLAFDKQKDKKTKMQQLIANLNKSAQGKETAADKNTTANLASGLAGQSHNLGGGGRENIQQLLQAAGQGLNQTSNSTSQLFSSQLGLSPTTASQLTAGQLASVKAQPIMMQQAAAANANAQALSNRLSIMHAQNMQVAEMRLDPPNLGRVRIQIRMQGKQASVNISAANPQAKELLEDALPKLKALLGEEGIDLADAQIFDSSSQENNAQQHAGQSNSNQPFNLANSTQEEGFISDEQNIHYLTQPLALVDYYA